VYPDIIMLVRLTSFSVVFMDEVLGQGLGAPAAADRTKLGHFPTLGTGQLVDSTSFLQNYLNGLGFGSRTEFMRSDADARVGA
jgi:hypothetical protein